MKRWLLVHREQKSALPQHMQREFEAGMVVCPLCGGDAEKSEWRDWDRPERTGPATWGEYCASCKQIGARHPEMTQLLLEALALTDMLHRKTEG